MAVAGVVGPIDLALSSGECLGLSGPSGVGKSLILRALADLIPHAGRAWLDGVAATEHAPNIWRRRVALVAAESAWWYDTVGPHVEQVSDQILAALGFADTVRGWRVARLSSGERQRLALARSLALQPAALLLDEPTAHLDAESATNIESLIYEYRREQGAAVLWVTHDRSQLARVADRRIELDRTGRLCS